MQGRVLHRLLKHRRLRGRPVMYHRLTCRQLMMRHQHLARPEAQAMSQYSTYTLRNLALKENESSPGTLRGCFDV